MYSLSVAQNDLKNQSTKPSWNDDPFDLKGTFTGVVNVCHKRNLDDHAQALVGQYAKYCGDHYELSLDMLPDDDKNELARLYIESIDREIESACYGNDESINSDFLCRLLAMLQNDCEETREAFAEATRKNVLVYYKKSLDEILDSACDVYLYESMNAEGYHAHRDLEHGEVVWGRF